ncbi:MAG: T9SS type A sorting domain-containing protein [Chitinophagales bacterium]|nr:T9SS type A sorting domain-containing protein [Bacteroidota bacterium]MCB9044254.1 T9SS type A sorting domain-containing protein [Chitinophagales bacterium]
MKAQDLHFLDEGPVVTSIDPYLLGGSIGFSQEVELKNDIVGKTTVVWERTLVDVPEGWEVQVCDPITCWLSSISTNSFLLDSGDKAKLKIGVIIPDDAEQWGTAHVSLKAYSFANPTIFDTIDFEVSSTVATGINDFGNNKDLRIFPNPVVNNLNIELINYPQVGSFEVYTLLGKKVATFFPDNNQKVIQYAAYDLPQGMYLLHVIAADGRILETKRFSKVK